MKKITLAVILTLLVNIFCLPLWTECDYVGFVRTLFNKEVRLDLTYFGVITQAEPFSIQSSPSPFQCPWFFKAGRNSRQIQLSYRARGKWETLSLQLKPLRDGKITMIFGGPDAHNDYGHQYSVLTDWKNLRINGRVVFNESKTFSYQRGGIEEIPVKKDEVLHIEVEFRRHHFTIRDFTFLKHGNFWFLITGNLLFFFLVWLLFSYFSKRCGRCTRLSDNLLVVTFFSLILIPMIDISDATRSNRENRMLAVKPEMREILRRGGNTGGGV